MHAVDHFQVAHGDGEVTYITTPLPVDQLKEHSESLGRYVGYINK